MHVSVDEIRENDTWDEHLSYASDFIAYPFSTPELETRVFRASIHALSQKGASILVARSSSQIVGLIALEKQEWDSTHFGFPIGRIAAMAVLPGPHAPIIATTLIREIYSTSAARDLAFLSARIDVEDYACIHALEEHGFRFRDVALTFAYQKRQKVETLRSLNPVRPAVLSDIDTLVKIATRAFEQDRFHRDPRFPKEKADMVYGNWVQNSFKKEDPVWVALKDGTPIGFITYGQKASLYAEARTSIMGHGLMVVDPRAIGAAISLVQATFEDVRLHRDAGEYDVLLHNAAVMRIYQRFHLPIVRRRATFHYWAS